MMYKVPFYIALFFSLAVFSQETLSKKEISDHKEEVKQTILNFFEGFHEADTVKIKNSMDQNMTILTVKKNKDGRSETIKMAPQNFLKAIKNRPEDQKWEERLLSFKIEANKAIANVWTPYEFYLNGTFSHCGVNVFQLFNDGTAWKIIAIADTRNKEECK